MLKNLLSKVMVLSLALMLTITLGLMLESKASAEGTKEGAKPADKKPEASAPAAPTAPVAAKEEMIDLNSASEDQLKTLPGITDDLAKKIVAGRPYSKKTELKTKKVIPADVYNKIAGKVIAKKVKKG